MGSQTAPPLTINSNATVQLTVGNDYTGLTTISSGTLQPTATSALSAFSIVALANAPSAILDYRGADNPSGGLSGPGPGGTVILGNDFLTVQGTTSTSFGGSIISAPSIIGGGLGIDMPGATQTLTGNNNTYVGETIIVAGTLQAGATNAFSPNTGIDIFSVAFLSLNNFNNTVPFVTDAGPVSLGSGTLTLTLPSPGVTYSGAITGTGGLTINSPAGNTWTMTGTGSNYSGPTNILSGILAVGANNATSANSPVILANNSLAGLTVNTGFSTIIGGLSGGGSSGGNVIVASGSSLAIDQTGSSTYGGAISGAGGLTLTGGGTLELTGSNNTISNGVNITGASTLRAGATNAFPPNGLFTLSSSAVLDLNGYNNTINRIVGGPTDSILLGSGTLTLMATGGPTDTYGGSISGSGGLTLDQTGVATFELSGTTTYSGPTTILAGTLEAGSPSALSPNSLFNLANNAAAVLNVNNFNNTIGGLAGGGPAGGNVSLGGAVLTIQGSNVTSYAGVISGTGPTGLILNGTGSLFLDGINTYTGTTTVNAGATLGGIGTVTSNVTVFGTMAPAIAQEPFTSPAPMSKNQDPHSILRSARQRIPR